MQVKNEKTPVPSLGKTQERSIPGTVPTSSHKRLEKSSEAQAT